MRLVAHDEFRLSSVSKHSTLIFFTVANKVGFINFHERKVNPGFCEAGVSYTIVNAAIDGCQTDMLYATTSTGEVLIF